MHEDKNLKIFFQNGWLGHRDRKNKFKDYSPKKIENSYLISSEQIILEF